MVGTTQTSGCIRHRQYAEESLQFYLALEDFQKTYPSEPKVIVVGPPGEGSPAPPEARPPSDESPESAAARLEDALRRRRVDDVVAVRVEIIKNMPQLLDLGVVLVLLLLLGVLLLRRGRRLLVLDQT